MPQDLANKISNFVSHATPDSPPPQAPLSIHGNGNIVAGGNVTVYKGGMPATPPSNQNLTACPACSAQVSVTANTCLMCGDDLANRRRVAWQEASQRCVARFMSSITIPYLAIAGAVGTVLAVVIDGVR